MPKQEQEVAEGGSALQAGRDLTVHQGMTAAQMSEIMIALAGQLHQFLSEAERKADERFAKFREEVLEQFSDPTKSNSEAFKDPDFQFLLRNAQEAYARSGDEDVAQTLVRLLAERSKQPTGSRISLILNQATETVGKLTQEELSALALSFVLLYTGGGAGSYPQFVERTSKLLSLFVDDLPEQSTSYDYLASLGCVAVNQMITRNLSAVYLSSYSGLFNDGFTRAELDNALIGSRLPEGFVIPCLNDHQKLQFSVLSQSMLEEALKGFALTPDIAKNLIELSGSKIWAEERVSAKLELDIPGYKKLKERWDSTPLSKLTLTALGTALGHSTVIGRFPEFDAPLSVWVQ